MKSVTTAKAVFMNNNANTFKELEKKHFANSKEIKSINDSKVIQMPTAPAKTKKHNKEPIIKIIEQYLIDLYDFRNNTITNRIEYKRKGTDNVWEIITDGFIKSIVRHFKAQGLNCCYNDIDVVMYGKEPGIDGEPDYIFAKPFDPFKDYFDNLPDFDGIDYISHFCSLVKVPDEQKEIWNLYFKKWIVGVVACSLGKSVNHNCLILKGGQGIGKTELFKILSPKSLTKYCTNADIRADKDSQISICENFILNLDELESLNKTEIGHIKSMITDEHINFRRPYDKYSDYHKRRASFMGSVNKAQFLTDNTGNRRFLVVETLKMELDLLKDFDIDKLYCQAYYLHNNGFKHWFEGKENDKISEYNSKYEVISTEQDLINQYFEVPPQELIIEISKGKFSNGIKIMTATQIYQCLIEKSNIKSIFPNKIGQALNNLGFKQHYTRCNNIVGRYYAVIERQNIERQNVDSIAF